MPKLISLPMYDVRHADTLSLLQALHSLLIDEGFSKEELIYDHAPEDLLTHWRHPHLLLSQTCGYPLCTTLPDVQVVGTFHYHAAGCQQYRYSSQLVVREADAGKALSDFRHRRVVCNSKTSQSGYHSLRDSVASSHREGRFFSTVVFSGSHHQSLTFLQANEADIAAIDSVTWALLTRHHPELTHGLASIGTTALLPGLPMITSSLTTPQELRQLRRVLTRLVSEPAWREACNALLIADFTATEREDYQPIYAAAQRAAASGIVDL